MVFAYPVCEAGTRLHWEYEGIDGEVRRLGFRAEQRLLTSLFRQRASEEEKRVPTSSTGVPVTSALTPDELIGLLERGAARGVHPRRILLALGFRPAEAPANGAGHVQSARG